MLEAVHSLTPIPRQTYAHTRPHSTRPYTYSPTSSFPHGLDTILTHSLVAILYADTRSSTRSYLSIQAGSVLVDMVAARVAAETSIT